MEKEIAINAYLEIVIETLESWVADAKTITNTIHRTLAAPQCWSFER